MRPEKWSEIINQIKQSFTVEDSGVIEDESHGGTTTEFIVFNGPLGRLRLEFSTHPVLLDTKTKYTHRIGAETKIDYIYSPTEKVSTLKVFRWDEELSDWRQFEADNLF